MRALVVVCRYLGDVLLATPLAKSLEASGYEVDWLVAPGTGSIIEGQSYARHIYSLEPGISSVWNTTRKLWKQYDLACVLTGSDRPMLVSLAAAKKTHALLPTRAQDSWKRLMSSSWIGYDSESHVVNYSVKLQELIGLTPCRDVDIHWSADDLHGLTEAMKWGINTPYVHIHPFARWPYKLWSDEKWQQLIMAIHNEGMKIVMTAAPEESEQAKKIAGAVPEDAIQIFAGALNWRQLAALSGHAKLYVGLDTANTHLAASTGVSTIAVFGPTNPQIWGPWVNGFKDRSPYQPAAASGVQVAGNITLVQGLQDCVPCQFEGCERNRQSYSACLDSLGFDRIWNIVNQHMHGVTPND
ncbi:MAG: glycosyltransferase family 9 protein [Mariprofundaceae bacterium]|nr:glycosyltransferase family 9 protein [Mariprofundaceae bacterium]